ncbi:hypothetical protein Mx8p23 [Myxococcus phage Mx8]|uniref:p23 n=1 Tax=Myxococcus phage Mx8 TaxID=49964 RepID=Q94MU6_9CAUD|nr:hypothetical protein Mx8p23 [Myxococcus phage Mx8]AAK94358.1 p23 [Myxococcus phage Mx8]
MSGLVLLACGSSGLTLAHLPVLRDFVRRFAGYPGAILVYGAGDARKSDAPEAFGADRLWEVAASLEWPWFQVGDVERFPANWKGWGSKAGPMRNEFMRDRCMELARDGAVVRWVAAHTDPNLGKGTRHMVSLCREQRWKGRVLLLDPAGPLRSEEAVS